MSDAQLANREIMRRIAERDAEAAAALFDRYAAEIGRYLGKNAPRSEREDLLQEIFARAFRGASTYRGQSSVRSWLYGIARICLQERYRRSLQSAEGVMSALAIGRARPAGPESLLIGAEERHRLLAALERLPDSHALVLELHRVDGLSHEEIGKLLGIEPSASRKRLQRALAALKADLGRGRSAPGRHRHLEAWRHSLLRRASLEVQT
jgi:RNA polymerase sigma factor (sigma-70 family)